MKHFLSETKSLNLKYLSLQMTYWAVYCILSSYVTVFLTEKDYSASQIGLLMSITNIIAAVLQPFVASFADRSKKFSLKQIICLLEFFGACMCLLLCLPGLSFYLIGLIFIVAIVCQMIMQPLISSVGMYYINRGKNINFGLARGMGSLAFTIISAVIGTLIALFGIISIPLSAVVLFVLAMIVILSCDIKPQGSGNEKQTDSDSYLTLIKENRQFTYLLTGVVSIFVFHSMINTYLYQITLNVGGDSQNMGIALAISALVELPVMFGFSKIIDRFPASKLIMFASVGWLFRATGFFLSTSVYHIYISQMIQMVSYGLFIPASIYHANEIMSEGNKIKGQSLITVAITIGGIAGTLIEGRIFDLFGISAMLGSGTVFTFIGVIFFYFGTRKHPVKK